MAVGDDLQEDETTRQAGTTTRQAGTTTRQAGTKITEKREQTNTTINNISGGGDEGIRKCALGKDPKAIDEMTLC